jgi:hypothetical protein
VEPSFVGKSVGRKPVYNITVAGMPEFVANGVLVHNCMDTARYSLFSFHKHRGANKYRGKTRRW